MENNKSNKSSNTLVFASNDFDLKKRIENWCQLNNKKIVLSEPDSPDIIAINSFAVIVDPDFVGKENLESFLEFQKSLEFDESIYEDKELVEFYKQYFDLDKNGKFIIEPTELLLTNELRADEIIAKLDEFVEVYKDNFIVEDIVDYSEQEIFKIEKKLHQKSFVSLRDMIPETIQQIREISKTKNPILGVRTGFKCLDRIIGGFRKGQLIVIASRPEMGKTSFALNMALNSAMYYNKKIAIFTLDLVKDELLMRMFSSASQVSLQDMQKGYGMTKEKNDRITQVAEILSEKEIYFDDNGANTMLDISTRSWVLKAELGGLDMIIIDYLQLMNSGRKTESRQQEISEISRDLKVLAEELELPIIVLSQLNRDLESRPDKEPMLSDLRESGKIEQNADIVMFIYRDEFYNPDNYENKGIAEISISKNRYGCIGLVKLLFRKEFTSFRSFSDAYND